RVGRSETRARGFLEGSPIEDHEWRLEAALHVDEAHDLDVQLQVPHRERHYGANEWPQPLCPCRGDDRRYGPVRRWCDVPVVAGRTASLSEDLLVSGGVDGHHGGVHALIVEPGAGREQGRMDDLAAFHVEHRRG